MGISGMLFGLFFLWFTFRAIGNPLSAGSATGGVLALVGAAVAGLFICGAGVWGLVHMHDTYVFYRHGAEFLRDSRVVTRLFYDAADEFRCSRHRRYGKGGYQGTSIRMTWKSGGRTLLSFGASYREYSQSVLLLVRRTTFSNEPGPFDHVCEVAAAALAPRFIDALSRGESFELANGHVASGAGISFARVLGKDVVAAYADIDSLEINNLELVARLSNGQKYTCVSTTPNFWPKFQAVQAFWLAARQARNSDRPAHVENF